MPFRKNHSFYRPMPLVVPALTHVVSRDGSSFVESVDSLADLPSVEDFSPHVQLLAGVPASQVSTIIKRPSVADYTRFADSVESQPVESQPVESQPVESHPVESQPVESQPV